MIIVTGAAGFIGSCLIRALNDQGHFDIVGVDDFCRKEKIRNLNQKQILGIIHRSDFVKWFSEHASDISFIYHLGARTDTTEKDHRVFEELNLNYSIDLWKLCTRYQIPLVYASSAATYGDGALGYDDKHEIVENLHPLNPYGISKNEFDKWALAAPESPPFWTGLKFFNVYGPNEYHKGRMASVVFHTYHKIQKTGGMKLFRSHRKDFEDGQQRRDFIYVKDIVRVCLYLMEKTVANGLYNIGTGRARSFLDLAHATFRAMDLEPNISFIDTPEDIRDTYQYFTQANMHKLHSAGYKDPLFDLEDGVADYVQHFLIPGNYY